MPEENESIKTEPIGGPQPVKAKSGVSLLTRALTTAVVTVGGCLIVAPLLVPTHVKGATRSGRLKWEQRQREAEAAVTEAALRGDIPASPPVNVTFNDKRADNEPTRRK